MQYTGEYKKTKGKIMPHGRGVLIIQTENGPIKRIGNFKNGKLNGLGMVVKPNLTFHKARYEDDFP